ncbi:MAG: IPT/TIG domain-containing protein [Acidobacteriia bacterium]|nr:IPT/TIG domain-containing protein [Terriglobia bacterium]
MSRRVLSGFASVFLIGAGFGAAVCSAQAPKFTISTVAGTGVHGFAGDGGAATAATLAFPAGIVFDTAGNLYIGDTANSRVRKIDTNGTITTFAGTGDFGDFGDTNAATKAGLNRPYGLAFDKAGNLYIADTYNDAIRKVTASSNVMSTVAGTFEGFGGDGGGATGALMDTPTAVVLDAAGNLYIADTNNHRIRKVGTDGNISTFVGTGNAASTGDGGPAAKAALNTPEGLAIDKAGNIYIADTSSHRVRKVAPDGTITTIAGNGTGGFGGDGGPATQASLYYPKGIALDALSGNLYIADWLNSRIRVVTPDGNIYTAAGNGQYDYNGDGGPATSAALKFPWGVAVDASGKVYFADDENSVIRLLTPVAPLVSTGPSAAPKIEASGVLSDSSFGGFSAIAPGTWIEIHGSNLAPHARSWTVADFHGAQAPTSLDGTTVTIGGQAAFISYISPNQINAQVPSGVGLGPQDIRVTTSAGASDPQTIAVNQVQPGLLAPAALKVGDKQYTEAIFPDGTTLALPAAVAAAMQGSPARAPRPGETIVLYGVGFGTVTPDPGAGTIVANDNSLTLPFQIFFGGKPATVSYAGLAPGMIGLYQFNVVVPDTTPGDAVPLTFAVGLNTGQQVLYTAVQR